MNLHLAFYALDIGPARNLALVVNEALARQHRISFMGNVGLIDPKALIGDGTAVAIMSLASFHNQGDILLLDALRAKKIPSIIVADTHNSACKTPMKEHVGNSVAVVASPAELDKALACGFNDAVYLGGPPLWRKFFNVKTAEIKPVMAQHKYVLVSGVKDAAITDRMLASVVQAMRKIDRHWKLILRLHPNENPATVDKSRRQDILAGVEQVDTDQYHIEELVDAVDISVVTGGGTPGITAAHLRAGVVYYTDAEMEAYMLKQGDEPRFFPAEAGAFLVAEPGTMAAKIEELLTRTGRANLQKRQAEVYPNPPAGAPTAERQIIDLAENLASNK